MPPGDAVSRKGTVDSLLLGCIPVHFYEAQLKLWPWHWGSWHANASVLLDAVAVLSGRLDVVAHLSRVPASEIARMRDVIEANAQRVHYSSIDTRLLPAGLLPSSSGGDAFDVAMDGAWAAASDEEAVARGRARLQDVRSQQPSLRGTCNYTSPSAYDDKDACHTADRGAFRLLPGEGQGACIAKCMHCRHCEFISYSSRWADCSWFTACDTLHMHTDVGGFEMIKVRKLGGGAHGVTRGVPKQRQRHLVRAN